MANEKRLIDANNAVASIKGTICKNCNSHNGIRCGSCWVDDTICFLENEPTVDAVEVVRCKDCKLYCRNYAHMRKHCGLTGAIVEDDDFCSCGERKDNGRYNIFYAM